MTRFGMGTLALLAFLLAARPAEAQPSLGAFTGLATGHIGVATGTDDRGSTLSLGGSVAAVEATGWGAELDFGWASDDDGRGGGLDAQSYTVNVIGQRPTGRFRPFVVAGAGAIHARTCTIGCAGTLAWTDWALTGGGGLQVVLNHMAGVRADVRYFTAPGDHPDPARPEGFSYWRIAVGATFLWVVQ